jgi:hypothetical protein
MEYKQRFTRAVNSWCLKSRRPVSFAILEFEDARGLRWESSLTWMRRHSLPEEGGMRSPGCTGQVVWIDNGLPIHHIYFNGVSTEKLLQITKKVFISPEPSRPTPHVAAEFGVDAESPNSSSTGNGPLIH